jgi:Polysaccharide biosynthesis C-terminal domain
MILSGGLQKQIFAVSDDSPPAPTSSIGHALSNARRSSPAFAVSWSATTPAYLPLVLLLPAMGFTSMQRVRGGAVIRAGTPIKMVAIYAMSLALNVILNLWWMPRWGPARASLASTTSYGVRAILFIFWTTWVAGERFSAGLLPRGRGRSAAVARPAFGSRYVSARLSRTRCRHAGKST